MSMQSPLAVFAASVPAEERYAPLVDSAGYRRCTDPLVIWFAIAVIGLTGASYETAIAWMQSPFNAIMMVLLIIATFHHMQLGLQVVIEITSTAKALKWS